MSHEAKWEYLRAIHRRYREASWALRQRILDEFCQVTGYHRKYGLRLLNGPPPGPARPRRRRRAPTYGPRVIQVLAAIWEAAGCPWAVRLQALLPLWLPWARTRFRLAPALTEQLLALSPRQMDRRLQPHKRRLPHRRYGRTKPGTLLKHHIPLKTDRWDVTTPGFTEIDLVAHAGERGDGEFLHSLNLTDIPTTWVETRAVLGRGQAGVRDALEEMRRALPFRLRGIDSDNGSEFINAHLYRYCQAHEIQFTRGRPYKKDDNAHIEQKNWTHVRKLFGYVRYDSAEALTAMNDLYRQELRLFQNLFLPSVKLVRKVRVGARVRRIYDHPQTPLERVLASPERDPGKVAHLQALRERLDPFALAQAIDQKLERLYALAHPRPRPQPQARPPALSAVERKSLQAVSEIFGIPCVVGSGRSTGSRGK
ncbi:MAG: DDE-type integrase/transposase/recombinase [candidate division NC10 bacterium]|nr:DDE-type integrase/transposase/recombinase [candidate division NC10 bacterium]